MAGDYIEIVSQATSAADPTSAKQIANVYHFARIAGVGTPSKSEIDASFQSAIMAPVLLALNVDYAQTFNVIRFFDDAIDLPQQFVQTGVGAIAGERLPDYVTATIRLKSNERSRSGRGRKSYGPLTEVSSTGDNLSTAAIALFQDVADALLAGFTDASGNVYHIVVKSSKPPGQYTVNPVVVNTKYVVACTVNSNLGILKRRKVKA